jgi:hypothetical protein
LRLFGRHVQVARRDDHAMVDFDAPVSVYECAAGRANVSPDMRTTGWTPVSRSR